MCFFFVIIFIAKYYQMEYAMKKDPPLFFDEVYLWTTYSLNNGGECMDFITFWTKENKIQVDWKFGRMKSLVYMDGLKDSAMFYSRDINYLEQLHKFKNSCPQKYIPYNKLYNELACPVY